ncbi:hypothetical protein KJ765_00800 [Candidatus Micrarchaeota archaeon]|nr:hypothetical protein [Candidatus Micrarchaeota archaeon]
MASNLSENTAIRFLTNIQIPAKAYSEAKSELQLKFKKEPSPGDVAWSVLNDSILECSHEKNYQKLSSVYYSMALLLDKEGKDAFTIRQQSAKWGLHRYLAAGLVQDVQILSARDSCPQCKKLEGKVFPLEEALQKLPVPSRACSRPLHQKTRGFCRCTYVAVV